MTVLSPHRHGFSESGSAAGWFNRHFGVALPRVLRDQAAALSWERFVAVYGQTAGPVRLGQWSCVDVERHPARMGPQARNFRAVIAVGDRIATSTAAAGGAVAALTAMLHARGIHVETLNFLQMCAGNDTATFVRGTDGVRSEWAMGWGRDSTESALRAVIACANRLAAGSQG